MLIVVLLVSEATMQNFTKNKSVIEHRQLTDCALAAGLVAVKQGKLPPNELIEFVYARSDVELTYASLTAQNQTLTSSQ